jgi:hypothetical protein
VIVILVMDDGSTVVYNLSLALNFLLFSNIFLVPCPVPESLSHPASIGMVYLQIGTFFMAGVLGT